MKLYTVINNANSCYNGKFNTKEEAQALADKLNDEAIDKGNHQIFYNVELVDFEDDATSYYESESWKAYYKSDDWYCYLFELVDDYANTPEADASEGIRKAIAKHLQADERKVWEILTAMECNEELTTAWACKELAQLVQ